MTRGIEEEEARAMLVHWLRRANLQKLPLEYTVGNEQSNQS